MTVTAPKDLESETLKEHLLGILQDKPRIEALVKALVRQVKQVESATFEYIDDINLNQASGDRLDKIGAIVGRPRDGQSDTNYRIQLQAQLLINRSNGLYEDLSQLLRLLIGTDIGFDFVNIVGGVYISFTDPRLFQESVDAVARQLVSVVAAGKRLFIQYREPGATTKTFAFADLVASDPDNYGGFGDAATFVSLLEP